MPELTEQQLEQIAKAVAKETIAEVFEKFGVDVTDVRGSQADFAHLRRQRLASEQVGKIAMRTLISLAIAGLVSVVLVGISTYLKQ